jgi:dTDP-4-dehydrorhamnose 3,5-epimerase
VTPFQLERISDTDLAWLHFERYDDDRGWLSEVFNQSAASALGLPEFRQDNCSHSLERGLVRGLHFQRPPHTQAKLFRVLQGEVFNVVVDLRPERFGFVHTCTMSGTTNAWIYIPHGYAHGFQTMTERVDIHYKLSSAFVPLALGAVQFDDAALEITWPLDCRRDYLSARDRLAAPLEKARAAFLQFFSEA